MKINFVEYLFYNYKIYQMENIDLFEILKTYRINLCIYLKKHCEYDYLRKKLIEIEKMNQCTIKDLFLGKIGNEINKQTAFYELPTFELLNVIIFLCKSCGLNQIEELASGIGLLSTMLKYYNNDIIINTTDGNRWIETSNKLCNVKSKLFLEYYFDNNMNFDDKLLIISWIPDNEMEDFIILLQHKHPLYIIIIGNILNKKKYNCIYEKLKQLKYSFCGIPVKQICYKDYYCNNKYNNYKSMLLFATLADININKLLITLKIDLGHCLTKKINLISDNEILDDVIINYEKPNLLNIDTKNKIVELYEIFKYIHSNSLNIPNFIDNFNDFKIWYIKASVKKYPLNITTKEKFNEYIDCLKILLDTNGLNILKENFIIPDWIDDLTTAEKFIWLDFSTTKKEWKQSFEKFIDEFYKFNTVNRITSLQFTHI